MARKALLTENEIRQFMKLARLDPVGDTRLQEFGTVRERGEEEELEDEFGATEDELGVEDHMADDEGDEIDDLETDLDIADETDVGGGMDAELEDMLAQGVEALAAAWGIEDRVEVEGGEGGDEDLGAPLPGDEEEMSLDMDMGMEPAGGLEVVGDEEEEEEEELPGSRMYETLSDDQIVQEVAKRVVARLAASQKKENLSEELAARILKRLTAKQA